MTCKETGASGINRRDIAIIGMDARTSLASNYNEFWNNIVNGVDCVRKVPSARKKDIEAAMAHMNIPRFQNMNDCECIEMAYLDDLDKFDYGFFRMTLKEAILADPCHRIMLESIYHALEDAGYGGKNILSTNTGVFIGFNNSTNINYFELIANFDAESIPLAVPGNINTILPSRIAYFLDLTGPSAVVDTGCSSGLAAVHFAIRSIQNGECDQAIVGGVKCNLFPVKTDRQRDMEATDGRIKAFDDSSDGIGDGEGVAAVFLKPLTKAMKDNDQIYAVIRGSAMNNNGKSMGLTVPNADRQRDVLVKAWEDAGINPETLSYIEAHGTGSRIGDTIEARGLINAFKQYTNKKHFCAISSVKTNIGHVYEGAGLFSLVKAALSLRYKKIPPQIHFKKPSRQINWIDSPVYVNTEAREWQKGRAPRRCGVTAYGIGGTNCHIVLEEAPERPETVRAPGFIRIFTLSAKSLDVLQALVKEYQKYILKNDLRLDNICYTANTGRMHLEYRLAVIAGNEEEFERIIENLNADKLETGQNEQVFFGRHRVVPDGNECVGTFEIKQSQLHVLNLSADCRLKSFIHDNNRETAMDICRLYLLGADLQWEELHKGTDARKISLPLYAFERKRCWVEMESY